MLFTGLKLANIPLTNIKLSDYLSQKSLITSFGVTSKEKELSLIVLQAEITDEQLQVLVSEIKTVAEWIGIKLTIKSE